MSTNMETMRFNKCRRYGIRRVKKGIHARVGRVAFTFWCITRIKEPKYQTICIKILKYIRKILCSIAFQLIRRAYILIPVLTLRRTNRLYTSRYMHPTLSIQISCNLFLIERRSILHCRRSERKQKRTRRA